MNDKSREIINAHDNLRTANNSVYEMTVEDIGFATTPLNQEQADVLIQWNRTKWEVPGVEEPETGEFSVVYFGDSKYTTVPGIETEDGSGNTKISDMVEDFSYSAELVSKNDGLPIGALHWDDLHFDHENSLKAIQEAYRNFDDIYNHTTLRKEWNIDMYPNPVEDKLFVRLPVQADDFSRARLINLLGEVLIDIRLIRGINELDVSTLGAGFYCLQFISEDNRIHLTDQFPA